MTTQKGVLDILIEEFEKCTDYRDGTKVYYPMTEILFLTFCGVMCGCESYQDIVDYGEMKLNWLKKYLPYKNGIPSHDTINRGLSLLDNKELSKVLENLSSYEIPTLTGKTFSIDGKMLSGSATTKELQTKKSAGGKQAIHTVNIFCTSMQICLGSVPTEDKGGEKKILLDFLDVFDFKGSLLTVDANFCHKDMAKAIKGKEADYVMGLKNNHPKLLEAAIDLLSKEECSSYVSSDLGEEEKGHGRIEKRDCFVLSLKDIPNEKKKEYEGLFSSWTGLEMFIKIKSYRKNLLNNKTEEETRYYISSKKLDAPDAKKIIREHWGIENSLHWVLDSIFGEDKSRKRDKNAAFAFSVLRKIAFNKLKNFSDKNISMSRKMRKCAMSNEYLENILNIF